MTDDARIAEWRERIAAAAAARTPLAIRGGGTKAFYGNAVDGAEFDVRAHAGIIDYDPTELVMTARAGTPLDEVEAALRSAGQMLAFEAPHFAAGATLGGCVAAGLSGPRRPYAGAVRDLVLGVRVLDGTGADLAFGGRVMKNVAGFDVARLMAGALGTLGVLLEVSFKCLPAPKAEATRVLDCTQAKALRWMNEWGARPYPISATCWHDGVLSVRLSGAPSALAAAGAKIGGDELPAASSGAFWANVRDHAHPFFAASADPSAALWRLSVASTAPPAELGGAELVEWGGALRWLSAGAGTDPGAVRAWAARNGGHATLFRGGDRTSGVFASLAPALFAIHRRLKAVYDPAGILNPGRFYPGL